ncbi:MAG: L-rhamnose mutarotase [Phycisphaerales bacterium JB039]
MKRYGQTLELVDDPALIAEYVEHHRRVWPEVIAALRAIGLQRMTIFLRGNRLFMYYEAPDEFDPARDYQRYTEDPTCRQWDELMRKYQRQLPGTPQGAWWAPMEEVFRLAETGAGGGRAAEEG